MGFMAGGWYDQYAGAFHQAKAYLSLLHQGAPVEETYQGFRCIQSLAVDHSWPNIPLTYTRGYLDLARQAEVVVGPDRELAPVVGQVPAAGASSSTSGTDRAALEAAELEADFAGYMQWLSELRTPATKIEHKERMDGESTYTVTFASPVLNIMTFAETRSVQFQASGRHGVRKWGKEKAASLAYTAYVASQLQAGDRPRYGCGIAKTNGCHGDARDEFYVYPFEDFVRRSGVTRFDPRSETFVGAEGFCWNCQLVTEGDGYCKYKCLGHSVGNSASPSHRDIQCADSSFGIVREQSEGMFLMAKQLVKDLEAPPRADGTVLSLGFFDNSFHACPPQLERLRDLMISVYLAHSKDAMTGMEVRKRIGTFTLRQVASVCLWQSTTGRPAAVRHEDEAAQRPACQHLQVLEAGTYKLQEVCSGFFYYRASLEDVQEYSEALEIEGCPAPSSLRVTGLDQSFTAFGLERGRLFQMYRVAEDTAAEMILLMHGAATLSLEGYDTYVLPEWCNLDQKANIIRDLGCLQQCRSGECSESETCRDCVSGSTYPSWEEL